MNNNFVKVGKTGEAMPIQKIEARVLAPEEGEAKALPLMVISISANDKRYRLTKQIKVFLNAETVKTLINQLKKMEDWI